MKICVCLDKKNGMMFFGKVKMLFNVNAFYHLSEITNSG